MKGLKYLSKVYAPFAAAGSIVYFTYYLINDILRHHNHSHGRPRILDDLVAFGIIGGGLAASNYGLRYIPQGFFIGLFFAPLFHHFKHVGIN
jgi:hypothetical protein